MPGLDRSMTMNGEDTLAPATPAIDISVVIVSWNTRDLLERCLHSITAEATRARLRVEIAVVDNASSDGTVETVRQRFPEVALTALPANIGFAAANNLAMRGTRGTAVLLLNPDTELLVGALQALWLALQSMPHVGVVGPVLLNADGSLQSAGYRFPGLAQVALDFFPLHPRLAGSRFNGRFSPGDGLSPFAIDHPLGACMLVRRTAIEQVGLLDEGYFMYSEEIDWCRRFKQQGWTILTAPDARVIHHGGQSTQQASNQMFVQLHRSRARYFARHNGRPLRRAASMMAELKARRCHDPQRAAALRSIARLYQDPEAVDAD